MAENTNSEWAERATPSTPASGNHKLYPKSDGFWYSIDDAALERQLTGQLASINLVIDGGGAAITTGVKLDIVIDFACTIVSCTLLADQSGSIVFDLWNDVYANFPPTIADTITASAKPTLSTAVKSQNTTLTGWDTAIAAGDILRINVDSAATLQRCTLSLKVRRI